jgi:hypothetical protein
MITNATDSKKRTKNGFLKKCVSIKNTVNQTELYETQILTGPNPNDCFMNTS